VKSKILFATFLAAAGVLAAQQASAPAPVPVESEPLHKVVFKNDAFTVMHLILPPGERTQYHTHTHDRIAVTLSATSTTNQKWNEAEGSAAPTKPGDIGALTLTDASYTHRVHNVGSTAFDVLDIEPAQRPATPSPDLAGPVAAETPSARVYNWVLAPGATSPMHTHTRPYIIVSVTALNLKMSSPDGQSGSHQVKGGDFHFVDGKVTHDLSNVGTNPGQIVEVELK
jgi:quercetin dioxygenase-like cupin family protein